VDAKLAWDIQVLHHQYTQGDDGGRNNEHEEIQQLEEQSGRGKREALKETQGTEGKVEAKFERIKQVNAEIARLKPPPRPLKADDFA
jgi:predicted nuclease with TOPRIM domain